MTTLEPPRSRAARGNGPEDAHEPRTTRSVPDWVRRQRRQERRLRRTVFLALLVLVVGAVVARWREDPGTVLAGGVSPLSAALTAANNPANGNDGPDASPQVGLGGTAADATPTSPATAHVDAEDPPATEASTAAQQPVPESGAGTITAVDIPNGPVKATGRTVAYGIDIEDGLPVSAADFAAVVHQVLVDDRGWQTKDDVRFVPVSPAERSAGASVDIRVTLASPTLTAKLCAPLDTSVQQVSCWNGSRAVLNLTRWIRGASTYGDDLTSYRDYLVSHEVGHGLGHGHVHCPGTGKPAPVMVQQTKSLEGCTAWPWPTNP